MGARARELGFRVSEKGQGRLLSDEVVKTFEESWLESVLPKISEKRLGQYFSRIDQAVRRDFVVPTIGYCLAASVLFDDLAHANTYLLQHALAVPLAAQGHSDPLSLIRWAKGRGGLMARHLGKSEDETVSYLAAHSDALLKSLKGSPEETAIRHFIVNGDLRDSCKQHGVSFTVGQCLLRIMASEIWA